MAEGGTGTGIFTHTRTGLAANATYVYRGYAVNGAGTAYSPDDSFTTLPLAPTVGTGSAATTTGFTATWSHPTMGSAAHTYTVEVDDDSNFGSINVTQSNISSANTNQAISGLSPGTTYYYRVRSVNSQGSSVNSSNSDGIATLAATQPLLTGGTLGSVLTATYPAASSGVSFTPTGVNLSADITVTAQSGYEVSTSLGDGYAGSVSVASGTIVYVRFAANRTPGDYNNATAAVLSSTGATEVNVTTSSSGNTISKASQGAVIATLGASTITFGDTTSVTVSGGSGTGAYEYQQNGGTGTVSFSGSGDSRTISVTTAGTANIEVRRMGDANYNDSSWVAVGTLTINKADQTITFGSLGAKTFGDAAFALGATASSGLPVSYASSNTNVATVLGSTVTIVGVGSTTITASQSGNSNFNPAASVDQNQTVNQATQTITFNLATNTVTAGTTNALSGTSSFPGLTVTYTSSNTNVASISGTNVIAVAAGVATITASQAGNVNVAAATPVSRTLNVAARGLGTIATWTFETSVPSATGVSISGIAAEVGSGVASGLHASSLTVWSNPSGNGSVESLSSDRWATNDYYQFQVSTVGSFGIGFSFDAARSSSGPATCKLQYSTNGTTFTDFGGSVSISTSTFSSGFNDPSFRNSFDLSSVSNIDNQSNVYFRIVATAAPSQTSGTLRVDNVSVTFSSAPPTPTITPSGTFPALTTTYGTPSVGTNLVLVSGGSLTSNITATAPGNFQVSADGTSWGGTATFTNEGGFASGNLFLRLSSNAPAGSYTNLTVNLTSGGASNRTVAISNSMVTGYPINIGAVATNKVYGSADPVLTYTNDPLLFSDTLSGNLTRTAGSNAGTYTIQQGTLTNSNYIITFFTNTFTINPAPLTITANDVTKAFGVALASPQTGSGAFTSSGLVLGESISSVTITYDDGASSGAAAGIYSNVVVPSAPLGINTNNYAINFLAGNLTVDASPTLTLNTATLNAFSTTYGTDSANQSFTVIGGNLSNNVTVAATSPFQVSTNSSANFTNSLELIAVSNAVPSTPIFVRLPATASAATNYTGTITVSSDGASNRAVSIAASTVNPKGLTIGGLSASNRVYDATTAGTVSGTPVYVGQVNGESNEVTPVVTWTFGNKNVGTNKALTASTNFAAPSDNYTISSQPSFSANITQATLTLTGAVATSRAYAAGNTNVAITGSLSGVFTNDTVGFIGTGTIASANAGTNLPVTGAVVLTGTDAGNYFLTQPTGLTVDITKANQTITFGALSNVMAGTTNALTATASSGLAVTYTSSNTNVATISGTNVIAVSPGVTTITASQTGDGNFNAATSVPQTLNVAASIATVLVAGWDFTTTTNGGTASAGGPNTPKLFNANFGSGAIYLNGTNGSSDWLSTELDAFGGTSVNARTNWDSSTGTGTSLSFIATTNFTANGKRLVIAFSMANLNNLAVTYASRASGSTGFDTHLWEYSTNASDWTIFDIKSGRTNTSYSTLSLSNVAALNNAAASFIRLTVSGATSGSGNNRLDNIQLNASLASLPAITPSGTFGSLSATYGTSSASSGPVMVSGGSLGTNDVTATPPLGFEVSTNGTDWAGSVSFAQSGGFASGNLFLRLATNATAGTYSNQVVQLTSGMASNTVAIGLSTVAKADPVITMWPTASQINYGQPLSAATFSNGVSTPAGNFAFASPTTVPTKIGILTNYPVVFTPTDTGNYNSATNDSSIMVNSVPQPVYGVKDSQNFEGFTTADLLESANGWTSEDPYVDPDGTYANGFSQDPDGGIAASIGGWITSTNQYRMRYQFDPGTNSTRLVFTWKQNIETSNTNYPAVDRFGWEFKSGTNNLFSLKMVQYVDSNGNGTWDKTDEVSSTPAEPLAGDPLNGDTLALTDRPGGSVDANSNSLFYPSNFVVAGYKADGTRLTTADQPNFTVAPRDQWQEFRVIVDLREGRWWAQVLSGGAFLNLMGNAGVALPAGTTTVDSITALWELNDTTVTAGGVPEAFDDTYERGGSNQMLFDDLSIEGRKIVHLGLSTPSGAVYDGTAQGATTTDESTGAAQITYSLQTSGVTNSNVPVNAGTYIASVGINTNTPYFAVVGTNAARLYTNSAIITQNYTIGRKSVTITGVGVADKIYNGTTNAVITGTPLIDGKVTGDDVSVAGGTANFTTADAGPVKLATISGYFLAGTAASNYLLTGMPISASAEISKKTLNVTAQPKTKVFGGSEPLLTYTSSGLVGSDAISGNLTRVNGENVGSYAIQQGSLDAGANYTLNFTGANFTITAAPLPLVTFTPPASLVYDGTAKTHTAAATGVGSFTYLYTRTTPAYSSSNAPTNAGAYRLVVTSADSNYAGSATNDFVVSKSAPDVTWTNPAAITYGAALSSTQLNATSSVAGTFTYSPTNGAVLNAGTNTLTAVFSATDSNNYVSPLTNTVTVVVNQANPTITWTNPAAITYGTALSSAQLNATADVPGSFEYNPTNGVVLNVGTHLLSVVFTPANTNNYISPITNTVSVVVNQATPTITWTNPTAITYGTALSSTQLNATSDAAGRFTYSPTNGAVLNVGTNTLTAVFTADDLTNYVSPLTNTVTVVVNQATPTITWTNPAAITYGTALSSTQLNATSDAAGSFTYSPTNGAVLNAGTNSLTAVFTATDSTNYVSPVTNNVSLVVNKATQTITGVAATATKTVGDASYSVGGLASSGLTLSYSSSAPGVATVDASSGAVTVVGAGSTTITVSQAGDSNYEAAVSVTQALTVNPAMTPAESYFAGFGLSGANAALTADPDGDGLSNAQEFAFGAVPNEAGTLPITTSNNGVSLKMVFLGRTTGVTYNVVTYTNLNAGAAGTNAPTAVNPQPGGVPAGYTQYEATVDSSTGTRKFMKVDAVIP